LQIADLRFLQRIDTTEHDATRRAPAHPLKAYSPECVEGSSLLKNSLHARFDSRSGPKHTVFEAFCSFWSPIRNHFQLSADFFNTLGTSPKFISRSSHMAYKDMPGGVYAVPRRSTTIRPILKPGAYSISPLQRAARLFCCPRPGPMKPGLSYVHP
jgi:hypothetical protein